MDDYRWPSESPEPYLQDGRTRMDEGDRGPPNKRQRVSLACSACRTRKSKVRYSDYYLAEIYDRAPADYGCIITDLETRVRSIERRLNRDSLRRKSSHRECSRVQSSSPDDDPHPKGAVLVSLHDASDHLPDIVESQDTDGMGISFVHEEDYGYYGPSSNVALMRQIFGAMARREGQSGETPQSTKSNGSLHLTAGNLVRRGGGERASSKRPSSSHRRAQPHVLPPAAETERLIRAYFDNTGLLFPYIHEATFLETYNSLKSSGFRGNVRRTWLGLLNMVLAMSTFAQGEAAGSSMAETTSPSTFFERAKELGKIQMLRGTTLEAVQFLLLTSQFLQGSETSLQTWTTHGLAVKAALSIGLHAKDVLRRFSPLEQEIRKRTWFGCVVLDRSLCMTFGRPSTIPEDYVRLPLPLVISGDGDNGRGVRFFSTTILLYRILWKVMGSLYSHNIDNDEPASETWTMTQIFQLDQELSDWQNALPTDLSLLAPENLPTEPISDPVGERYRAILTLRFLNTKLLLHRPVFMKSLGSSSHQDHRRSFGEMRKTFNTSVVRCATDSVTIVHTMLTSQNLGRHLLGAWWFTLFYVFHASLATFGSALVPVDQLEGGGDYNAHLKKVQQTLRKAVEAMPLLTSKCSLIDQCVEYISQLSLLVDGWIAASETSTTEEDTAKLPPLPPGIGMLNAFNGLDGSNFNLGQHAALGYEDPLELGPFFNSDMQWWVPTQTQ